MVRKSQRRLITPELPSLSMGYIGRSEELPLGPEKGKQTYLSLRASFPTLRSIARGDSVKKDGPCPTPHPTPARSQQRIRRGSVEVLEVRLSAKKYCSLHQA